MTKQRVFMYLPIEANLYSQDGVQTSCFRYRVVDWPLHIPHASWQPRGSVLVLVGGPSEQASRSFFRWSWLANGSATLGYLGRPWQTGQRQKKPALLVVRHRPLLNDGRFVGENMFPLVITAWPFIGRRLGTLETGPVKVRERVLRTYADSVQARDHINADWRNRFSTRDP